MKNNVNIQTISDLDIQIVYKPARTPASSSPILHRHLPPQEIHCIL